MDEVVKSAQAIVLKARTRPKTAGQELCFRRMRSTRRGERSDAVEPTVFPKPETKPVNMGVATSM